MGKFTEPPVGSCSTSNSVEALERELKNQVISSNQESVKLTFQLKLTDNLKVKWDAALWQQCLYIHLPNNNLPDGSKERLVFIL